MPRSNWKGFITFGLVNIPIVLYNAQDPSSSVSFKQINRKTGARIKYKRVDAETGKEVPWDEIVRGYEYDKDVILPVGDDELKRVAGENARTIAIEEFVDKDNINFINIENTYYLVPGKKGEKGYVILREALKSAGKVGIAKVIISTKEYLAAVSTYKNALVLYLLHYQKELRDMSELDIPSEDLKTNHVTTKEIDVAKKLVASMTEKWKPEKFKDEYKIAVEKWVNAKVKKLPETHMKPRALAPEKSAKTTDFMELMKQSIGAKSKGTKKKSSKIAHLASKKSTIRPRATRH